MKVSLAHDGIVLDESNIVDRFLDPAVEFGPRPDGTPVDHAEPVLINTQRLVGQAAHGDHEDPEPVLASDYVKANTDLATMEAASEAARRAVNGLLDRAGYRGQKAPIWNLEEPGILATAKIDDGFRYALGLPHKLVDRTRPATAMAG
jgi:hypothetical protein